MSSFEAIPTSEMEVRYQRALAWMQGFETHMLVQNDYLLPHWIKDTTCFWYERATKTGKEFRWIDALAATNKVAFDHEALAGALGKAINQDVDKNNLPIHDLTFTVSPSTPVQASSVPPSKPAVLDIHFAAFGQRWIFYVDCCSCTADETLFVKPDEALSPDGKFIVFRRNHNLWLRDINIGEEWALTHDGQLDFAYGEDSTGWGASSPVEEPILWAPDSKRLLTVQRDKRQVLTLPIVNHVPSDGSIRPTLEQAKVAYPGDEYVEQAYLLSIDIATGEQCRADYSPLTPTINEHHGFYNKRVWWAADGKRVYIIDDGRDAKVICLLEFDTDTGNTRQLIQETSDTYINVTTDASGSSVHRFLADTNELIWWSQRSDWGHLYLYDLDTGALKNVITAGEWCVRDIVHVDVENRELILQTAGRDASIDPYYRDICRVNIDTGALTTVFSSDEDWVVNYSKAGLFTKFGQFDAVSPCGQYLVATRSRVDQMPVSVLIDRAGNIILTLEKASFTDVFESWYPPKPVQVLAADGKTNLYGVLFYPSNFSPDKQYPIINMINGAPWLTAVPKASFRSAKVYSDLFFFYCSALAELGFIVLILDSRGTPLRSKSFQDESYGWIPSAANTDDHAGAIAQLTKRYSYMDNERVGIFTVTGYRSALQNFLERQDIYQVCVQMNLMDNRLISCTNEGDKYEGRRGTSAGKCYPEQLVENLCGKLLLLVSLKSAHHSPAYPAAATLRVIDALQKANKDFDQVIVGTGGRARSVTSYQYRRAFDYLVKHLQGEQPPKEFSFQTLEL